MAFVVINCHTEFSSLDHIEPNDLEINSGPREERK